MEKPFYDQFSNMKDYHDRVHGLKNIAEYRAGHMQGYKFNNKSAKIAE